MKKKFFVTALAMIMIVTAIAGASLAYLTDTDSADNVFTVGNVKIDLYENFKDGSKLLPGVYDAEKKVWNNAVTKEVFVTNIGSEDVYVRVHIAIPAILDDVTDANSDLLHFDVDPESYDDGLWSRNKTVDGANEPEEVGDRNMYTATIKNVEYNVYVVTYKTALASEEETCSAMSRVYLDSKVNGEKIAEINQVLGEKWSILVIAEGVQAAGFTDAFQALNTAFGVPGSYDPYHQ